MAYFHGQTGVLHAASAEGPGVGRRPNGFGNSVNNRAAVHTGNGVDWLARAKKTAKISYFITLAIACVIAIACLSDVIPYVWTHNEETVKLADFVIRCAPRN